MSKFLAPQVCVCAQGGVAGKRAGRKDIRQMRSNDETQVTFIVISFGSFVSFVGFNRWHSWTRDRASPAGVAVGQLISGCH